MLSYNTNQNLLKGLKSTNKIASFLYENRYLKKKMLDFLKQWSKETGQTPKDKWNTIAEVLDEVDSNWRDFYKKTNLNKKG